MPLKLKSKGKSQLCIRIVAFEMTKRFKNLNNLGTAFNRSVPVLSLKDREDGRRNLEMIRLLPIPILINLEQTTIVEYLLHIMFHLVGSQNVSQNALALNFEIVDPSANLAFDDAKPVSVAPNLFANLTLTVTTRTTRTTSIWQG